MSDPVIWYDWPYWAQTAVICAKEFVGVLMFLVAYSRMGMFDTFTAPLVLYMVLVVMAFPFLNSYLVFLMRYGPWYVPIKEYYRMWMLRTVLQFCLVTVSHGLGAWAASAAVKSYTENKLWKDAAMVRDINGADVVESKLSYRAVADSGEDLDLVRFMFFLEEFVAVFILLVGILHLMEAITPRLLQSAFWNPKDGDSKAVEHALTSGAGFSSRHRDMSILLQRVGFNVKAVERGMVDVLKYVKSVDENVKRVYELEAHNTTGKVVKKVTEGEVNEKGFRLSKNEDATLYPDTLPSVEGVDSEKSLPPPMDLKTYVPVPFMLVFQICILLAGVSRAFPSAHLSLHVSVYNACMETNSFASVCLRVAGGFLAANAALLYYFVWYVWVKKPDGENTKLGSITRGLYNNLLEPQSALLRSEMFRLPASMAITIDRHSN